MRYSGFVLLACLPCAVSAKERTALVRRTSTKFDEQDTTQARIVGGHDSVEGRHFYMASLWSDNRHECGGVLVAPDVILTAAHCIQNGYSNSAVLIKKAILGRWDLNDVFANTSTVIQTEMDLMHPDYDLVSSAHDVALYKLVTPAPFHIPTVKINKDTSLLSQGTNYKVLGWGDLGNGTFPKKLQTVAVHYVSLQDCRNAADPLDRGASYATSLSEDMMCASGSATQDACYGDSGGPLLVQANTRVDDVVVALVSWGIDCARLPGVYARIDVHDNWIQSKVCDLSEDPPSYFQCAETTIGGIRDESPTTVPLSRPTMGATRPPTPQPTRAPPTRQPYSMSVVIPPIFNMPPAPTKTRPPVSYVWQWTETRASSPAAADTKSATTTTTPCLWKYTVSLLLSSMLVLEIFL